MLRGIIYYKLVLTSLKSDGLRLTLVLKLSTHMSDGDRQKYELIKLI